MKNEFAIKHEKVKDGTRYVFVDTSKALMLGIPWRSLGDFGKRKFENLLFLTRMNESKQKLSVQYV